MLRQRACPRETWRTALPCRPPPPGSQPVHPARLSAPQGQALGHSGSPCAHGPSRLRLHVTHDKQTRVFMFRATRVLARLPQGPSEVGTAVLSTLRGRNESTKVNTSSQVMCVCRGSRPRRRGPSGGNADATCLDSGIGPKTRTAAVGGTRSEVAERGERGPPLREGWTSPHTWRGGRRRDGGAVRGDAQS